MLRNCAFVLIPLGHLKDYLSFSYHSRHKGLLEQFNSPERNKQTRLSFKVGAHSGFGGLVSWVVREESYFFLLALERTRHLLPDLTFKPQYKSYMRSNAVGHLLLLLP